MARKKIHPTSRTRTVELDGKPYTVEFTFLAYDAFEQLTGISLLKGWNPADIGARGIACFLFAGLLKHHSDLDLQFCYDKLSGENFNQVYSTLLEAYMASLPKKDEDANPPKPVEK